VAQINLVTFPWKVKPVHVAPNGVILVNVPAETPAREIERVAQVLKTTLNAILPEDAKIQIILAYEGITVEALDEPMMNRCGWQRIPNPPS
jgi:hypothetical protein